MNEVIAFFLGACVGSFLNVCIYRIPAGESIVFFRSKCKCGASIPVWLNVPIFSWLILRGRAQCCGGKISARYFIVEAITAILFCSLLRISPTWTEFAAHCIFCSLLLVIAFIDIDTMSIYDAMSIGGVLVGILYSLVVLYSRTGQLQVRVISDSISGICLGSGMMFWIAEMGELAFGREAIGAGDIKLLGMIGAFLGWKGCLFSVFGGCLISSVFFVPAFLVLKFFSPKNAVLSREVPFAPFLVVGAISYLLIGQDLLNLLFPVF